MTPKRIHALLNEVAKGQVTVEQAMQQLHSFPVATVQHHGEIVGRLDTQRAVRHGFPEVIFAQGKPYGYLKSILSRALAQGGNLLVTRLSKKTRLKLQKRFPALKHVPGTGCLYQQPEKSPEQGLVAVFCAGTSDIPVAEEAALIARLMGARVETYYDAGVAGLHRLLAAGELLQRARVFVVVAGMEGAMPSVVGGLVDKPVIAVPTSTGYGVAFQGVSALLGMLNACSANVTVVNIDNGFGAGYVASLINRLGSE